MQQSAATFNLSSIPSPRSKRRLCLKTWENKQLKLLNETITEQTYLGKKHTENTKENPLLKSRLSSKSQRPVQFSHGRLGKSYYAGPGHRRVMSLSKTGVYQESIAPTCKKPQTHDFWLAATQKKPPSTSTITFNRAWLLSRSAWSLGTLAQTLSALSNHLKLTFHLVGWRQLDSRMMTKLSLKPLVGK